MSSLLRLLGSLKIAVALLIAIAATLAYGTFYEARLGTAAVQRFIYHSWWFETLLAFLAANLAAAAAKRYPWQRKHIPFVSAHIGIILLLTGGILGGRFGVEGQMILAEGESASSLRLSRKVLVVHQPNPGIYREIPTNFEATAWVHEPNKDFTVPLSDRTLQLTVDRYYPNAQGEEEVVDGAEAENPAVRFHLYHGEQDADIWLFAQDPHRFGARWGNIHFFFLQASDPQELSRLLRFGVEDPLHKKLLGRSFILIRTFSGKWVGLLTDGKGGRATINPFQIGKKYAPKGFPHSFEVSAFYPRAATVWHFTNQDDEVRSEALHLIGRDGEKSAEAWLPAGGSVPLLLGEKGHPLVVSYRPAVHELPFSVKLLDFRRIDYPGTQMAQRFESDVELSDPTRNLTLKRTIRMNNPLKYRGFSFFQSSYIPGSVETTVLSVRNDPGIPLVYGGFLIIVAGVVGLFIFPRTP